MNDSTLSMRWAGPAFAALFILSLIAFWPGYLAVPKSQLSGWLNLHAVAAALWMCMLIAQPLAIHSGHRDLHRRIGYSSLILMPVLVISILGLAHFAMRGKTGSDFAVEAFLFYIRVVLVLILVASYVMAMVNRGDSPVHARYMICSGLTLVDPVVSRLAWRALGRNPEINYQIITFGIVCVVLLILIWMERRARSGRHVFPVMLAAFFLAGLPLALQFYKWKAAWEFWISFTTRFAELPIP